MKILFITTRFYPSVGGVEQVVEKLAVNLSKRHEVKVLTSLSTKRINVADREIKYQTYYLKRIWMSLPRSFMGSVAFPYRFIRSTYEIVRFIKRYDPDVINYHFPDDSSLYVCLAFLFTRVPIVLSIHGNDLQVFSKKFPYKMFIPFLIRAAKKIVVNSEYMRKEFIKSFSEYIKKVEIISNGVDITWFEKIKPKRFLKSPYVFYVGRFVYKKGVDILLKAFSRANIKGLKLLAEGKGEKMNKMIDLCDKLGIKDKVVFTMGSLSHEDKISYMKVAEFGVLPSRIEPFGIVALEMMASGLPLIASRTGGLVSIIEDESTGVFFENRSVHDLARKMKRLHNDKKFRTKLSENALKKVRMYSWDNISKKYESVFSVIHNNL